MAAAAADMVYDMRPSSKTQNMQISKIPHYIGRNDALKIEIGGSISYRMALRT